MLRMLASIALELLANAIGIIVAFVLLDGFDINVAGFIMVVIIYTVLKFILDPLVIKMSIKYVPAFRGGVALITTFTGLLITSLISDNLSISGVDTWVIATLIVWLFGVIASLILPLVLFKEIIDDDGKKDRDHADT